MKSLFNTPPRFGLLTKLSGVCLALVLCLAPLAWACARDLPLACLIVALHSVAALWLTGLVMERRMPAIPPLMLICAVGFLAYAWLRYCLVPPAVSDSFTLWHFSQLVARWPESMIARTPYNITALFSGFIFAMLVACDQSSRVVWRRTLVGGMVLSGFGVIVMGLLQNYTQAPGIYWQTPKVAMPSLFFGPFYHFTSAGAFINLVWPLAASLAFYYLGRHLVEHTPLYPAIIWGLAAQGMLLGHAGHISRVPQVIAGVVLVVLLFAHRFPVRLKISHGKALGILFVGALLFISSYWIVTKTGRLNTIGARWKIFEVALPKFHHAPLADVTAHAPAAAVKAPVASATPTAQTVTPSAPLLAAVPTLVSLVPTQSNPGTDPRFWPPLIRDDMFLNADHSHYFLSDRGASYWLALRSIVKKPLIGYGPGGWMAAASQNSTDPLLRTFFHYLQFTHEDYLQTMVEWGLVGASLLGVLIFGGLIAAAIRIVHERRMTPRRTSTQALTIGAWVAVAAVLTQSLYDFPLQIPANALYLFVLVGILWSARVDDTLGQKKIFPL